MPKSVLKRALGLGTAVVEGARIEGESIIVSARLRRAALYPLSYRRISIIIQ